VVGSSVARQDAALLRKLMGGGTPLGEIVEGRIYRGILTGLNDVFVVGDQLRANLIAEDPRSAELLKPVLEGRDVRRWYYRADRREWLLFTRRGTRIDEYPAVKAYLESHRAALEPRPTGWISDEKWPGRKPGVPTKPRRFRDVGPDDFGLAESFVVVNGVLDLVPFVGSGWILSEEHGVLHSDG
jgi:hypothetical protein